MMDTYHARAEARNTEVTPTFSVVSTAAPDRAWWAEEASCAGTDWASVVETAIELLLAAGIIEPIKERPGMTWDGSTFRRLCLEADARQRAQVRCAAPAERSAPPSTVEALMVGLRERGVAALNEAAVRRRLLALSDQQLAEVCARLQPLKPKIARAWSRDEAQTLIETREKLR
jgi:hypothetical protein